ncbi:MAG: hypothetical protein RR298_07480 [Alistipes sp.]
MSRRLKEGDRIITDEDVSGVLFCGKMELTYRDLFYYFKWGATRINGLVEQGVITPVRVGRRAAFSSRDVLCAIRRGLEPLNVPAKN